eukprot:8554872-Ditylum_brightwellii.AAC.1
MQQLLRDNYAGSDIFEHVRTKIQLGTAYERQQLFTKICLVKLMHNWLNTGHQKKKINENA